MGTFSLVNLAREFWTDEARFRARYAHPWLVWSVGRPSEAPIVQPTLTLGGPAQPTPNQEPLAIPLVKGRAGTFALGVTIGRTENNDVVLRHEQVSRFHAYLIAQGAGFALVDADSKNGTRVNGLKLEPTKPQPLPETATIRLGELQLRYYAPEALIAYLRNP
jgi:hypothetical protein